MPSKKTAAPNAEGAEVTKAPAKQKPAKTPAPTVAAKAPAGKPGKPAKQPAVKAEAATEAGPRGRAPKDGRYTINAENAATRVSRGFTREFLDKAIELNKVSRGKGVVLSELFAEFPDKSRAQLMDCFYACTEREVFIEA